MTERLYYTDPYLRSFDATVGRVETRGERTLVFLDRTAFYPTSGGQPFDLGTLDGCRVVDVVDEDDGSIAHVIERRASAPETDVRVGRTVHGEIDWPRRFDHMQQHTGQHVLSAAFDRRFGVRTVSFHLGAETATIDLARGMTDAEIAAAEADANRVVWEDRPVTVRFASKEDASRLPLRKEPVREGTLRLVDVDDFDLSACGGTHVARTGAIGVIAVASWERFKGGQRLEFLCGGRALKRFGSMRDALASSVRLLSVLRGELPDAIGRLQAETKQQKRTLAALQTDLARFRAEELAAAAEPSAAGQAVITAVDADANGLKTLAASVVSRAGHVAVLVSTSAPALVVVARSSDLAVESQRILATLLTEFGGRGGGRPELAQGGGLEGSTDAILAVARRAVNHP